ncbi:cyclin-dependent kinase inhibitor 4-like [Zingiber officinale]|uniref:cyclin-dependent kinase inhibitor 4-like n=1 Tax=Zingiber officinale TaxID=94328 RepID=UPI001C4C26D8|nr:cyclin-dependent kinase inhibitor 4-like [Zingiber officinale]XP_042470593.1 cyclin-dependent kinase inhibitor 4-like [Zingiber officinale]
MGKYMRKAKVSGEVAVMEVTHQSALGVRTRARALAAAVAKDSSCDYLVLRSRRLEKPLPPLPACKDSAKASAGPCLRPSSGSAGTGRCSVAEAPPDAEASFGENVLEAEARDRHDRETTPCSLIRNPEAIQTPCSTNRRTNSRGTNRRTETFHQNIPTTQEMEEFFSRAEQLQCQIFVERYNFDPVDDHPLPGRYKWVKVDL